MFKSGTKKHDIVSGSCAIINHNSKCKPMAAEIKAVVGQIVYESIRNKLSLLYGKRGKHRRGTYVPKTLVTPTRVRDAVDAIGDRSEKGSPQALIRQLKAK